MVEAHKRGCVATALDIMHACPRVPPDHLVREVRRQHVGFHTAKCKDRHLDAGPVFPEINALMPWISECPYDLRIEEHDVTLSAGMPSNTVAGDVAPLFVRKAAKWC